MLFQLNNEDGESMGLVDILGVVDSLEKYDEILEELTESWEDYYMREEHDKDPTDIDEFVEWHNENYQCQIERVFVTEIDV